VLLIKQKHNRHFSFIASRFKKLTIHFNVIDFSPFLFTGPISLDLASSHSKLLDPWSLIFYLLYIDPVINHHLSTVTVMWRYL